MRNVFILLMSLLSACTVCAASQTEPLYQVEIIVFSQVSANALLSEQWPATPLLPSLNRVKELTPLPAPQANNDDGVEAMKGDNSVAEDAQTNESTPFAVLPASDWQLTKAAQKIAKQGEYQVLLQASWLMPALSDKKAPKIHIYGGQAYGAGGEVLEANSPLMSPVNNEILPSTAPVNQWQINGFIKISKPYLFQADADLVLTLPKSVIEKLSSKAADTLKTNQFVLNQTYRLRLGQLYYFDHPLFGMLMEITKYQQVKNDESTRN